MSFEWAKKREHVGVQLSLLKWLEDPSEDEEKWSAVCSRCIVLLIRADELAPTADSQGRVYSVVLASLAPSSCHVCSPRRAETCVFFL